jgi:hypothetical protein
MKIAQSRVILHNGWSGEIDFDNGEAEAVQVCDPERA